MPSWPEATLFVVSKGMLIADYGTTNCFGKISLKASGAHNLRIANNPAAERFIRREEYRKGWAL